MAIVKAGIEGEAEAKAEFAAASRKIATDVRRRPRYRQDRIRQRQVRGRADATIRPRKRPPAGNAEKTKPIEDCAGLADSISDRLAVLAADVREIRPRSRAAGSRLRVVSRSSSDPGDELFTRLSRMDQPLQLLEGLIIPKSMKEGARPGSPSS